MCQQLLSMKYHRSNISITIAGVKLIHVAALCYTQGEMNTANTPAYILRRQAPAFFHLFQAFCPTPTTVSANWGPVSCLVLDVAKFIVATIAVLERNAPKQPAARGMPLDQLLNAAGDEPASQTGALYGADLKHLRPSYPKLYEGMLFLLRPI